MDRRGFLERVGGVAGATALAGSWPALAEAAQNATASPDADQRLWRLLKAQFAFAPDYAYLNTAGLGASPLSVSDRVKTMMDREEANPSPGHSEEEWTRIRGKLAALLGAGCSADEMALVSTATEGINIILNGLGLAAGDEVVTSTHEHPALNIPLLHHQATTGIVIRTFEPDLARAEGNVERLGALLTPRTRLVFVSHVTCTTGQVMPVEGMARLAASRGIPVALDGAQSLAQFPIDLAASGVDYYTASGHKFLMGPKRTGVLYVRRDRLAALRPTVVGAYSDQSWSMPERRIALRPNAQRYEYGTQNDALVYGLEAAADLVTTVGLERIWAHNRALADACREGLAGIAGADIVAPAEAAARSAILSFRLRGRSAPEVAGELGRRRLRVRVVSEVGLDAVRVSFHICNDASHVSRLLDAVARLAQETARP